MGPNCHFAFDQNRFFLPGMIKNLTKAHKQGTSYNQNSDWTFGFILGKVIALKAAHFKSFNLHQPFG
jgi:hypothetical protein